MRLLLMGAMVIGTLFDSYGQRHDSATLDQLTLSLGEISGKENRANIYKKLGGHYYEMDIYQEAKAYYYSSLILLSAKSDHRKEILKNYSFTLLRLGEYRESIKILDELIPLWLAKETLPIYASVTIAKVTI